VCVCVYVCVVCLAHYSLLDVVTITLQCDYRVCLLSCVWVHMSQNITVDGRILCDKSAMPMDTIKRIYNIYSNVSYIVFLYFLLMISFIDQSVHLITLFLNMSCVLPF